MNKTSFSFETTQEFKNAALNNWEILEQIIAHKTIKGTELKESKAVLLRSATWEAGIFNTSSDEVKALLNEIRRIHNSWEKMTAVMLALGKVANEFEWGKVIELENSWTILVGRNPESPFAEIRKGDEFETAYNFSELAFIIRACF